MAKTVEKAVEHAIQFSAERIERVQHVFACDGGIVAPPGNKRL
jgi:hypothetical protein